MEHAEVVTDMVLWVSLFAVNGAVTTTVSVVEPEPEGPELTVGVTDTVQAELEETADTVIVVLGVTPLQLNAQDWLIVAPGDTNVESAYGVIDPPQGLAADTTVGRAKITAKVPNSVTASSVFFENTKIRHSPVI